MGGIFLIEDEAAMRKLGASLAGALTPGEVVLLFGDLGAGKTTFVRGYLEAAGWTEPVRSPTFNLIQLYPLDPPILHADLYRVATAVGLGLEDYIDDHISFVEWPQRLEGFLNLSECWRVDIQFSDGGRIVEISAPK
jgi:tRNA threonylcarbamoyladenosine biosynthesis protein TsaE